MLTGQVLVLILFMGLEHPSTSSSTSLSSSWCLLLFVVFTVNAFSANVVALVVVVAAQMDSIALAIVVAGVIADFFVVVVAVEGVAVADSTVVLSLIASNFCCSRGALWFCVFVFVAHDQRDRLNA